MVLFDFKEINKFIIIVSYTYRLYLFSMLYCFVNCILSHGWRNFGLHTMCTTGLPVHHINGKYRQFQSFHTLRKVQFRVKLNGNEMCFTFQLVARRRMKTYDIHLLAWMYAINWNEEEWILNHWSYLISATGNLNGRIESQPEWWDENCAFWKRGKHLTKRIGTSCGPIFSLENKKLATMKTNLLSC